MTTPTGIDQPFADTLLTRLTLLCTERRLLTFATVFSNALMLNRETRVRLAEIIVHCVDETRNPT